MRCFLLRFTLLLVGVQALSWVGPGCMAQSPVIPGMPANWQNLSASEFATESTAYFANPAAQEMATPIVQHAWTMFLASDNLSAGLNPLVRRKLILVVQPRANWIFAGSAEQITTLNTRLRNLGASALSEVQAELQNNVTYTWAQLYAWQWVGATAEVGSQERQLWESAVLDWKARHDISRLGVRDLWALKGQLERDLVDRKAFSARWTGFLTAPTSGEYVLHQLRSRFGTGQMKVWLGEQLVLNTTKASLGGARSERPWQSTPVAMVAQQPVSLTVEYIYNQSELENLVATDGEVFLFPFAVLSWAQGETRPVLIPKDACTPPKGYDTQALSGLKAEYYSDITHTTLVQTRLDPGVGMLWPTVYRQHLHRSIAPYQPEALADVITVAYQRSLRDEFAPEALISEEYRKLLIRRVSFELNAWEGLELLDRLSRSPAVLARMAVGAELFWVWEGLGLIPGETRVRLLANWSQANPEVRARVFPNPRDYAYFYANHSDYQQIGRWLRSPDDTDLNTLIDNHLENPDGSCRLNLFLIIAHALLEDDKHQRIRDLVAAQLAESPARSDVTASWLIARAWAEEAVSGVQTRVTEALPHLDEAFLAATSPEMKFRVLQEIYPRLICLGRTDEAIQQIDASLSQYTSESQQQTLRELRDQATSMAPLLVAWNESQQQKKAQSQKKVLIKSLTGRIEKAEARGDAAAAQQYRDQLNALEQ